MIKPRNKNLLNPKIEMKSVDKKLIIMCDTKRTHYFFMQNGRISEFYVDSVDTISVGDIFLGRVERVNKSLNGCFVLVNNKDSVYVPYANGAEPIIINRKWNGTLNQEDQIVIQIKKEANEDKKAAGTYKYKNLSEDMLSSLKQKALTSPLYTRLHSGVDLLDHFNECTNHFENTDIICNDIDAYTKVEKYLANHPECCPARFIKYADEQISLVALYGLKKCFDDISLEKVWLKSGGYLYIDKTKAMTVIDVNSGKIVSKDRDKAILTTNLEAANEIAYQIKARNLSGIIIVDYINMEDANYNTILINAINESFIDINPAPKLVDITKLGLAEIIRPKMKPDIYEYIRVMDKTILM